MAKPNATALGRFKSQIESEANKKIIEVKTTYPFQEIEVKPIVRNGGGRLRSSSEIRASISNNSWGNTINIENVFDLDKEREIIKRENAETQEKRDAIIAKINKESDDVINKAYFGEGELSEFLKEFSEKVFK